MELYVGLMSGTSLDGIDTALVDFSSSSPRLIAAKTYPLPPHLREDLITLCLSGNEEIERMGRADRYLGIESARAVNQLLADNGISSSAVRAIGSHGQTIRHRPALSGDLQQPAFTLQIGDPNTIAEITGITTIGDFRRRDIAAGGQGAPLVPAFHRAVFSDPHGDAQHARAIVNIGGIANITGLGANDEVIGFDTGPGNTLLDQWIHCHTGANYDCDGAWGAKGRVIPSLLDALLCDPYFGLAAPKSTGREYFHLEWLQRYLTGNDFAPLDVQTTLVELTARTIVAGIAMLPFTVNAAYVCGGGAYNHHLMARLETLLNPCLLVSTAQLGIAPEWVEAAAFAWLAKQTLHHQPGNLPAATGAAGYRVLGAIYPA